MKHYKLQNSTPFVPIYVAMFAFRDSNYVNFDQHFEMYSLSPSIPI